MTQYNAPILSECAETLFKGCSGRARSPFHSMGAPSVVATMSVASRSAGDTPAATEFNQVLNKAKQFRECCSHAPVGRYTWLGPLRPRAAHSAVAAVSGTSPFRKADASEDL